MSLSNVDISDIPVPRRARQCPGSSCPFVSALRPNVFLFRTETGNAAVPKQSFLALPLYALSPRKRTSAPPPWEPLLFLASGFHSVGSFWTVCGTKEKIQVFKSRSRLSFQLLHNFRCIDVYFLLLVYFESTRRRISGVTVLSTC